MKNYFVAFVILSVFIDHIAAQCDDYWQQRVKYTMKVDMDVNTHRYNGYQHLVYFNNSPDTLKKVFYHLYFNAFQPGSQMDMKAGNIIDPDNNLDKTISNLKPDEIGYEKIFALSQDGEKVNFNIYGTILKAYLKKPLAPGDSTVLEMRYEVQVPLLCRRAGRDNAEGVDYSMAQWYPKLAEYDRQGWHAEQYIGREFYGVWGDFDVTIDIDRDYIVAAGTETREVKDLSGGKRRYHFHVDNVHDFVWAADRDYKHFSIKADSLTTFHFYFQDKGSQEKKWRKYAPVMVEAFKYMNEHFGRYPYSSYSFIEGGDGGMEYPLATLIRGGRSVNSLIGISTHEFLHSWYQMVLATNESLYPWMDEGFTTYAEHKVLKYLTDRKLTYKYFPPYLFENIYENYRKYIKLGYFEPLNTHADHYSTNYAYWNNAYSGGAIFLNQLEYVIGKEDFDKGLLLYFDKWKFKHPTPVDFIRVMEKTSDLQLFWYLQYFMNSLKHPDFAIGLVRPAGDNKTEVILKNLTMYPMPVDIEVQYVSGKKQYFSIPVDLMLGHKKSDYFEYTVLPAWDWVVPFYTFTVDAAFDDIKSIEIDSSRRLFDLDRTNNTWENK